MDITTTRARQKVAIDSIAQAFEAFGDIEAALDRQIYPEQQRADFDDPDDAEYHVVLTAGQWRQFGRAMAVIEKLAKVEG